MADRCLRRGLRREVQGVIGLHGARVNTDGFTVCRFAGKPALVRLQASIGRTRNRSSANDVCIVAGIGKHCLRWAAVACERTQVGGKADDVAALVGVGAGDVLVAEVGCVAGNNGVGQRGRAVDAATANAAGS